MKREVLIPEEVVNKLEKLNYEYNSIKDNVCFLMDAHRDDAKFLETNLFKEYLNKQIEKFTEYETAKLEMQKEFLNGDGLISWNLDFPTKTVTAEYTDEK